MEENDEPEVAESNDDYPEEPPDEDFVQGSNKKSRHTCDVYLAQGAYTDCNNILNKFLSLQTSTFEDFLTIWKERNFSAIFSGRDSFAELLEFCEEVLAIAKSFILPPHSQIKRIGALYLMYGLYTQQPLQGNICVKYRVTPQEWNVILKFVENLKAYGFIDANYIFHKMILDGAFLKVAMSREYGLERNYRKYLMPWEARDQELDPCVTFSLETLMSRVYRGSLKTAADKCSEKYSSIKNLLAAQKDSKFLGLEGTDKDLHHVMLENIESVVDVSDEFLEGTKKCSNIGLGRKSLKKRAFVHQIDQKGAQSSLLGDTNNSAASTSHCDTQNLTDSEDDILLDSDSDDIDFQFMIQRPNARNSRKIKALKVKSSREIPGGEEKVPSVGRKRRGTTSRKAVYEELTRLNPQRGDPCPISKTKKKRETKKTKIKDKAKQVEISQKAESCPVIDVGDEKMDMNASQTQSSASSPRRRKWEKSKSFSPPFSEELEVVETGTIEED